MHLLIALIITIIVLAAIEELASYSVYGWFVKEADLDEFFPRKWEQYRANGAADRIVFGVGRLPYLSRSQGVFWKWYIKDIGRIPRWSKWTSKLDGLYAEIWPIKSLRDY